MTHQLKGNPLPVINTEANLVSDNTIFLKNQVVKETDTGILKVGDGVTAYNSLGYYENIQGVRQEYTPASGTDTYTASFKMDSILGYFTGLRLRVKFTNANTGASTINLNSFGAKAIKKSVSTALAASDILAGGIYELTYDGTNFQIGNSVGGGGGGVTSVSGTLNRITSTGGATPVIDIDPAYDLLWQPIDADLTSIAALGFASTSFLKKTAANTWALDTNTYLTSVTPHDVLSATHSDTLAAAVVRGDLIIGNSTPKWSRLAKGATGKFLTTDANDTLWSTSTIPTSAGATANKVLLSDGTNYVLSTPTFPNASATSGKLIISDGTNWIASTITNPNSATTGDLLYASASNVYSNLSAVATGYLLGSQGTSTAPAWLQAATLNTSLTTPLHIGGTTASSSLELRSTSGVGTSDYIKFTVGNNGASEIMRIITGLPASATGGTITTSGGYTIHTFTTSGTFTPNGNIAIDYLVVAGGAGGGDFGGGGAGGMKVASTTITVGSYAITIGAGGAGGTAGLKGTSGSNSSIATIYTSTGGGGGGAFSNTNKDGANGGSGGGAGTSATPSYPSGAVGTGTAGEGNNGGLAVNGATAAGGGGGAGAVGGAGSGTTGGVGGAGTANAYSGASVTYSGGGGGGGSTGGAGGAGGGGAGVSLSGTGTAGTTNTGGGGGGGYASTGGAGGSGIVIIRYITPASSGVGILTATPTAYLHIGAGASGVGFAPLKLTSGTNLTTAETGAFEYNGTNLFFTRTGTTRENIVCASAANSVSPTSPNRTITINVNGTTYYLAAKTTND